MAEAIETPAETAPLPIDYPTDKQLLIVRAVQSDYVGWSFDNPSLALAAAAIGPVLGIGQIAAAQTIALYRDWIS